MYSEQLHYMKPTPVTTVRNYGSRAMKISETNRNTVGEKPPLQDSPSFEDTHLPNDQEQREAGSCSTSLVSEAADSEELDGDVNDDQHDDHHDDHYDDEQENKHLNSSSANLFSSPLPTGSLTKNNPFKVFCAFLHVVYDQCSLFQPSPTAFLRGGNPS